MQAKQRTKGFADGFAKGLAVSVLPILIGQGGCSGDVNPVKAAYIGAGYGPRNVAAPDFVESSRREGLGYMPVGTDAPKPANRPRTAESRRALEAELEGARSRNEARGRAAGTAAAPAKPAVE